MANEVAVSHNRIAVRLSGLALTRAGIGVKQIRLAVTHTMMAAMLPVGDIPLPPGVHFS